MPIWNQRYATVAALDAVDAASLKIASNGSDIANVMAFRRNLGVAPWLGHAPATGDYTMLSFIQEEASTTSTTSFTKNTGRYSTFAIDEPLAVDRIGIYMTTAATAGTAVGRFGLYSLDANNKPDALVTDISNVYGTIDLTTAAPVSLTVSCAGLTIPAGKWAIGVGWDGTAAGPTPITYGISGQAPSVGTTTVNPLTTTGYSAAQSWATTPASASPGAVAVLGIAVFARIA